MIAKRKAVRTTFMDKIPHFATELNPVYIIGTYHGMQIAAFQSGSGNKSMSDQEIASPAPKSLSETAKRALAEAEARRRLAKTAAMPRELGGRGGEDPVRYGDWEARGIAHDF